MLFALEQIIKLGLEPHIRDSKACALTHPAAYLSWAQITVLGCSAYQEAAIHPSWVCLLGLRSLLFALLHPWYLMRTKSSDGERVN